MTMIRRSRREFLRDTAALGAALALPSFTRNSWAQTAPLTSSALVPGKISTLTVHKGSPVVLESPLDALREPITPANALFVRNNQDLPGAATLEPFAGTNWTVNFSGLLSKDAAISLADLQKLPQTTVEMVLQCSGNRRAKFSEIKPTEGTQWGSGGIGNVQFTGPKLTDVLKHLQIEPKDEAIYLCAEGEDGPKAGEQDFEHSTPLGDVLETALLALQMNGQPLPRVHGGPVRLVIPGYYATVSAKWLTKLRFESSESRNINHASRYRTPLAPIPPGSKYDLTIPNSTPTWRMKIATLVTEVEKRIHHPRVFGFVWNDGRAKITKVGYQKDVRGEDWFPCQLAPNPDSPYGWSAWSFEPEYNERPVKYTIRAEDELGRSQPMQGSINWNPHGYEWHAAETVTL